MDRGGTTAEGRVVGIPASLDYIIEHGRIVDEGILANSDLSEQRLHGAAQPASGLSDPAREPLG